MMSHSIFDDIKSIYPLRCEKKKNQQKSIYKNHRDRPSQGGQLRERHHISIGRNKFWHAEKIAHTYDMCTFFYLWLT